MTSALRASSLAALVVLATSFPVLLMGTAIGLGEVVAAIDEGIAGAARLALFVLAIGILGLAFATPYLGWRLGGRRMSRAQPTVVA